MIVRLIRKSTRTFSSLLSTAVAAGAMLTAAAGPLAPALPITVQVQQGDQDLAALIRGLSAPAANDRAMAACRISRMRGADVSAALGALIALLADGEPVESRLCREWGNWRGGREQDSSPGREAAIALERVGERALEPLLDVLDDGTPIARENAAMALGLLESSRALDALADAARDDQVDEVRARAAWALGMIESSAAIDTLEDALQDEAPIVREQAAWALGMIEASAAVPALNRAMEDADALVREQAAWALGMIEAADAVAGLRRGLRDESAGVREQSAWALGMIESADGVEPLLGALRDDDADVREQAAWALGMIESSSAVQGLLETLRDDDAEVRQQSAWALGMIEDGAAIDGLMAALEDEDVEVRKHALWALTRCIERSDAELDYAALAEKLRRALLGGGRG